MSLPICNAKTSVFAYCPARRSAWSANGSSCSSITPRQHTEWSRLIGWPEESRQISTLASRYRLSRQVNCVLSEFLSLVMLVCCVAGDSAYSSCKEIRSANPSAASGDYSIRTSTGRVLAKVNNCDTQCIPRSLNLGCHSIIHIYME